MGRSWLPKPDAGCKPLPAHHGGKAVTNPVIYRRRSPLIEAIQVTAANAADLAETVRGRVDWIRDRPLIHVPCSVQPARLGDWIARDLTRDRPWYPIRGDVFEDGYEPIMCPTCTCAGPR